MNKLGPGVSKKKLLVEAQFKMKTNLKSFMDGAADCFDNRRGADDFYLLLIS